MNKLKITWLAFISSLFFMAGSFLVNSFFSEDIQSVAAKCSEKIQHRISNSAKIAERILHRKDSLNLKELYSLFEDEMFGIYILENDSLIVWNNSRLPVLDELNSLTSTGVKKLKHGFFAFAEKTRGNTSVVVISSVKPEYDLQNNYLKNTFREWTGIPKGVDLSSELKPNAIVSVNAKPVFALKSDEKTFVNEQVRLVCSILFCLGFGVLLVSLLLFLKINNTKKVLLLILAPLLLLKLLISNKPDLLFNSFLYDVRLFSNANSVMNYYLADVIFNAFALLFIAVCFHMYFNREAKSNTKILWIAILFALLTASVMQYSHLIKSLVNNSTLSFEFLNVFNIRTPVLVALLSVVLTGLSMFVLLYKIVCLMGTHINSGVVVTIALLTISGLLHYTNPSGFVLLNFWPVLFGMALFLVIKTGRHRSSLGLGLLVFLMSVITSGLFNYYISKNEKQELPFLADKLSERQDAMLESEFAQIPGKIRTDNKLQALMNILPFTDKEIQSTLKQKYFSGYFNRYNIDFSLFDADCKPLITPLQPLLLNEGFFEDQIKYYSDSTVIPELFFVEKFRKNSRYIGKMKLSDKTLYVLLEPKQFEELGSFPDLLLDESQQKQGKLEAFSYAVYRGGQNSSRFGDYNYPFYLSDSLTLARSSKGFLHYYFSPDESTHIIISSRKKGLNYFFTYNSYLFLCFSLVCFICYYIYSAIFTSYFRSPSLTRRIQTIVIVLLLLAMSAVGITSASLVTGQFKTENIKQLHEKTQTIINELNTQFKPDELFSAVQKDLVNLKLKELAHLFNTDISLYNQNGRLFNTSQPQLYEKGLAAGIANPDAYFSLINNEVSMVNKTEKAGTLDYLSLYTPVFSGKNRLIGFVNLPYFARQSDLVSELSGIISALINVYVILFVASILAGLILAGYITTPLRLIKQQISNITLGKQNEAINWKSNDEVGKLVNEYNNMLLKLEHSANLLAQSERESAWREMAKQVAHEIKNPLTPMKLNLQYLQHLIKSNPKDFKEKFEKASAGIIEQIDTLATIATEFSNFARLPGTRLQEINLREIINASVNLFEGETKVKIITQLPAGELMVTGDREQVLRVFNNLLKNAIQATGEVNAPRIEILCEDKEEKILVTVRDNGSGISENQRPRIFQPNFTTKSTGSGLGLAMVKNIMTNLGGSISFDSEEHIGTSFFLEFRKAGG